MVRLPEGASIREYEADPVLQLEKTREHDKELIRLKNE